MVDAGASGEKVVYLRPLFIQRKATNIVNAQFRQRRAFANLAAGDVFTKQHREDALAYARNVTDALDSAVLNQHLTVKDYNCGGSVEVCEKSPDHIELRGRIPRGFRHWHRRPVTTREDRSGRHRPGRLKARGVRLGAPNR